MKPDKHDQFLAMIARDIRDIEREMRAFTAENTLARLTRIGKRLLTARNIPTTWDKAALADYQEVADALKDVGVAHEAGTIMRTEPRDGFEPFAVRWYSSTSPLKVLTETRMGLQYLTQAGQQARLEAMDDGPGYQDFPTERNPGRYGYDPESQHDLALHDALHLDGYGAEDAEESRWINY